MSTTTSREEELVKLAREFLRRSDDMDAELDDAVDWALGDEFRGRLRRIIAEHDYQTREVWGGPRCEGCGIPIVTHRQFCAECRKERGLSVEENEGRSE